MAVSFLDAINTVINVSEPLRSETIAVSEALGRVLSQPVVATNNDPPFDRSAMDGYAVRAQDVVSTGTNLTVVGSIFAGGGIPALELGPGSAMRIMTGAPLPRGADAVQMVENTVGEPHSATVKILKSVERGANIRWRGEVAKPGDVIIEPRVVVTPERLAVLVGSGYTHVQVYRQPTVCVLATGDELVEPGVPLKPGQLYESNRVLVAALCQQAGARVSMGGIVADDPAALSAALETTADFDVLVLSGGVSVGDKDIVADLLRKHGVAVHVHGVAIQPGKPLLFGTRDRGLVFGLPGNPVSTAVTAKLFLVPALKALQGLVRPLPPLVRMPSTTPLAPGGGRLFFAPAIVECRGGNFEVKVLSTLGSADTVRHARRNAFLVRPAHAPAVVAGEDVWVIVESDGLLPGTDDYSSI